jgi:hypothetical protein
MPHRPDPARPAEASIPVKTRSVQKILGATYHQLWNLIHNGFIPTPRKDASGDYCWSADDIERARELLSTARRKQRKVVVRA